MINEATFRPGELLAGKYVVESYLGQGGMGIVLKARHAQLQYPVALKVLHEKYAGDARMVARMAEEARAQAQLRSLHVARVVDAGYLDERLPFITMEYLEGEDLGQLLLKQGWFAVSDAVDLLLQTCHGVADAHAHGIIHRDLKPENLFLSASPDSSSVLKVLDFGIAKRASSASPRTTLTNPNAALGSPHYMAPEQMRAASDADCRSDIWALGAIFYELLTGQPPFDGDSLPSVCVAVMDGKVRKLGEFRSDVPAGLDEVLEKCLQPSPSDRYQDVGELAMAIARFGGEHAVEQALGVKRVLSQSERSPSVTPLSHRWLCDVVQNSRVAVANDVANGSAPVSRRWHQLWYCAAAALALSAFAAPFWVESNSSLAEHVKNHYAWVREDDAAAGQALLSAQGLRSAWPEEGPNHQASVRIPTASTFREADLGTLIVSEPDGSVCGIVTDRDIVIRAVARRQDLNAMTVDAISSMNPVCVSPFDTIDHAVETMVKYAVRRIPVVQDNKAVGIVSIGDLAVAREPESALGAISGAPAQA